MFNQKEPRKISTELIFPKTWVNISYFKSLPRYCRLKEETSKLESCHNAILEFTNANKSPETEKRECKWQNNIKVAFRKKKFKKTCKNFEEDD